MLLLICVLKDYRRVEDLLLGFVGLGIAGATVVEGRGMGQILSDEHPLFVSIRGLFPGSLRDSHVVFSVTDEARAQAGMALFEQIAGDARQPGTGIAFTVPVNAAVGLAREIE
ncbi:MAG: hypothetical protein R3F60_02425 [bacterium]